MLTFIVTSSYSCPILCLYSVKWPDRSSVQPSPASSPSVWAPPALLPEPHHPRHSFGVLSTLSVFLGLLWHCEVFEAGDRPAFPSPAPAQSLVCGRHEDVRCARSPGGGQGTHLPIPAVGSIVLSCSCKNCCWWPSRPMSVTWVLSPFYRWGNRGPGASVLCSRSHSQ